MASQPLSASLEDYLETIFHIITEKQVARAKDISKRLGVNNSSVTGALRTLAERKLINYAPYEVITLTVLGRKIAREVVRKHEALKNFFVNVLSINESKAEEAACRMEHAIPRPVLDRLAHFAEFVKTCPRVGSTWIRGFEDYCKGEDLAEDCEKCISLCMEEVKKRSKKKKKGMG